MMIEFGIMVLLCSLGIAAIVWALAQVDYTINGGKK